MQPLNARQAAKCEEAGSPRCQCRCGGQYHGARRTPAQGPNLAELQVPDAEEVIAWLRSLPEDDPHYVRTRTRKLQLRGAA